LGLPRFGKSGWPKREATRDGCLVYIDSFQAGNRGNPERAEIGCLSLDITSEISRLTT